MADDAQYESHKRKYEENTSPARPPRRVTGFSAPIVPLDSDAPPPAYGNVPPPIDEFELAKQKLKELASRALNAEAKRSKVDNGGGFAPTANVPSGVDQKFMASNLQPGSNISIPVSHGYTGSKKIEIPNGRVGVIIGKAGETIKYLQVQSGARIQVTRDADHDPNLPSRMVELMGNPDQIAKAEQLINEVLSEATAGASGAGSRRLPGTAGSEQFAMRVPNNKVGLVIGKGGETIKNIQATSGARVQVIPLHPPPGDTSGERTVQIEGSSEQIEIAKQMVNEVIENRLRNPGMSGGYSQQQGYQAQQQPTSWAPQPPQVQQPGGYGYMQQQPGAYPGSQSQYGTQPPYSGYPPQQQTPGGYSQNWDQSSAPQSQQGTGGYDYYGQQVAPQQQQPAGGTQTDNSGYNYGQPPTSGGQYAQQGYTQDGYGGGYQAQAQGQAQAPPPAQHGYDQQQGYGSTTYTAQGEANPNPNPTYPTQGSNQGGYGMPPTSQAAYPGYAPPQGQRTPTNPPAYGQPQQSPSQVGGYNTTQTAPGQPGYPPSQPPAAAPTYGGAAAQPGAYPSPYGAPPVTPPSYGQQPPAYYGGAYSQPPAYPTDGATPPAPAAAATAQPSAAAKASPQS